MNLIPGPVSLTRIPLPKHVLNGNGNNSSGKIGHRVNREAANIPIFMASDRYPMTAKPVRKTPEAQTPAWQKDIPRYLAFLIVLCFLLIRIGFREIPIERDEGSYAYMGQLVMKGEVPYRDFYEMKPPALYYTYGVLSALSGGDVVIMHIWMALLVSMGGMLLFYLVRRWLDAGAGVIATLAYLVLAMTPYASGFSIQAEHLVAFFAIAGLLALTRGCRQAIAS